MLLFGASWALLFVFDSFVLAYPPFALCASRLGCPRRVVSFDSCVLWRPELLLGWGAGCVIARALWLAHLDDCFRL